MILPAWNRSPPHIRQRQLPGFTRGLEEVVVEVVVRTPGLNHHED
ncbi:MAG TPA: hypothetical protein PK036_16730 [Geobacteraceae bacterium]|nr:hypothetical protein [Geobacteraceae bacterium]